jgi:hypothetical protein
MTIATAVRAGREALLLKQRPSCLNGTVDLNPAGICQT